MSEPPLYHYNCLSLQIHIHAKIKPNLYLLLRRCSPKLLVSLSSLQATASQDPHTHTETLYGAPMGVSHLGAMPIGAVSLFLQQAWHVSPAGNSNLLLYIWFALVKEFIREGVCTVQGLVACMIWPRMPIPCQGSFIHCSCYLLVVTPPGWTMWSPPTMCSMAPTSSIWISKFIPSFKHYTNAIQYSKASTLFFVYFLLFF